ncbi:carboxypeptidase B-like [Contarinia nasturtii]|uniref:carboxypeptidase B-like n=1 Tax=Contarinia nasturtii TaxID=265458 RepID=UPI0012D470C2|nr:carboxypeptidase B-like [Contarinia nasturtii]
MAQSTLSVILLIFNCFLFIESVPTPLETPVRYDGAQLWNVDLSDEQTRQMVFDLENEFDVSFWSTSHAEADMFLKKSAIESVRQILNKNNIEYSVRVDDMQKRIEEESSQLYGEESLYGNNNKSLTWDAYYSFDDILLFLDKLVEKYPNLCSLETIGYSHENRPLKVLKISNGNSGNKAIWIDGGIHAREWISPASVTYIVNDLVENWNNQPAYIQNVNWYVLPVHNPDGYEYTRKSDRMWRKNRSKNNNNHCLGVDLNRNYGYKWGGKGTSSNPCSEIYAGSGPFSEPESTAVKNFVETSEENFDAFLTFHSYGQWILYPWGYENHIPTEDRDDLDSAGRQAAKSMKAVDKQVYTVGNSADLLYAAAGGSDDWGKSVGIKYSYTIELRDKGRYGFVLPPKYILATAKEAHAFVFTFAQIIAAN